MINKDKISSRLFEIFNTIFLIFLNICMIYPFIYTLSVSISSPEYVSRGLVAFLPKGFDIGSYNILFEDKLIIRSYFNTAIYTVLGTMTSLLFLVLTAYPLSIKKFHGRKPLSLLFIFTMYFSGGMIPTYLIVKNLGMINTIWAVILTSAICVWPWYLIMSKTFFQDMPDSIRESAHIDGANEWVILFKIVIPLSKPLLSTMALFSIVTQWNSYISPLLYLTNENLYPLQLVIRRILAYDEVRRVANRSLSDSNKNIVSLSLKSAAIIVSILPIICVYPFIQKYFIKGVMIGAIKG